MAFWDGKNLIHLPSTRPFNYTIQLRLGLVSLQNSLTATAPA